MPDLNGKRTLVTGGSRGIGVAIALAPAEPAANMATGSVVTVDGGADA